MPEESLTPEERLLRLIRGKGKEKETPVAPAAKASPEPEATKQRHFPSFGKRWTLPPLLRRRKKTPAVKTLPFPFHDPALADLPYILIRIQQGLVILVGVSLLFFFASRLFLQRQPLSTLSLSEETPTPKGPPPQETSERPPYDYYGQVIGKRNLFRAGLPAKGGSQTDAPAIEDRLKDFALLGIVSGTTPQAIVEDKEGQKTYFLTEGEALGEMRIEQILEEKVTMSYEGELYELVL